MRQACAQNIRMKATGTKYAFGNVAFTDGWLIDMSYLRHPNLMKQLNFEKDERLLNTNGLALISKNDLIICESGTTIEMIHNVTWPVDKKTGRRWSVFRDQRSDKRPHFKSKLKSKPNQPTRSRKSSKSSTNGYKGGGNRFVRRSKYKILENIAGWDKLSIGGLVNVGAQGFGNDRPLVQRNVLSFRLLTVISVKHKQTGELIHSLKEYQIEPTHGIHDAKRWKQYYEGRVELIQDDDVFNSALVSAGTFGIVYSYHLKLIDAFLCKQQKILTNWDKFKQMYEEMKKFFENGIIYRFEVYVAPYEGFISKGVPTIVIVEYKTDDNAKQTRKINGNPWVAYLSGATLVWASKYLPIALPLFNELAWFETAHDGLVLDALKAFQLGSPAAAPGRAAGMGVRTKYFIQSMDRWLHCLKMAVKKDDEYLAPTGVGITWSRKDRNGGFISMAHEKHDTTWIEIPTPDYSNENNFFLNKMLKIGLPPTWNKLLDLFFGELRQPPYYGKSHLGLEYRLKSEIWKNKQYYPHFDKFLEYYKVFNQSRLFSNKFTMETELDYLAFDRHSKTPRRFPSNWFGNNMNVNETGNVNEKSATENEMDEEDSKLPEL